ncbi:unnamed protein product, partial [Ectocarpus sp. 4 AP-2014]
LPPALATSNVPLFTPKQSIKRKSTTTIVRITRRHTRSMHERTNLGWSKRQAFSTGRTGTRKRCLPKHHPSQTANSAELSVETIVRGAQPAGSRKKKAWRYSLEHASVHHPLGLCTNA